MERVEALLAIITAAFFMMLLIWVLRESCRGDNDVVYEKHASRGFSLLITITAVASNAIISVFHLGFSVYQYKTQRTVSCKSLSLALTWALTTIVSIYSRKRRLSEKGKWPFILTLWWFSATLMDSASVLFKLKKDFKSIDVSFLQLLSDNIVEVCSFPFLLLLSANSLPAKHDNNHDLEQNLLQKEAESSLKEDLGEFTNAGLWSYLSFGWLNPVFERGRIQKIELAHIPSVPKSEKAENASSVLEESFRRQNAEESSLTKAVIHSIWKSLIMNAVFAGVSTIASYMGPLLITSYVNFLSRDSDGSSFKYGVILAFLFFLSKTVESLTQRQWYFCAQRIGIQVRAALFVLIYRKSISIDCARETNGKIVNLVSVDAEQIGDFCFHIHEIWLLPVQVILALFILYKNLGFLPSIAAVAVTIFVMASNTPLAKLQKSLHSKIMEAKDSRIKATSETLKHIRILKMHSWETSFLRKILKLRETEKRWLQRHLYISSISVFLFWTSPTVVALVTFGVCILIKTELTAAAVLSAIATFGILTEPIYNLPQLISNIARTKVSINRIQEFVKEDRKNKFLINNHTLQSSRIAMVVEPGEYAWDVDDKSKKKPTIRIAEKLEIEKGCKVAICGSVGSGKSSLLSCMLGEIPRISREGIKVYGNRSYAPQSPWIQSGTIRDNVLFGKEMNEEFYERFLDGCALHHDINMWEDGDLTLVGERGIKLSGGQKQRIQLARAIYNDADIYFLDDPFSAVDTHTGSHLYMKCLMQVLSKKTVVYATHQLEFLEAADFVLVMKGGEIVETGKYKELITRLNSELVKQMAAHKETLNHVKPIHQTEANEENIKENMIKGWKLSERAKEDEEEAAETGRVKWSVYSTFVSSAYGGTLVPFILLCHVLFQAMQIGSNYWIAWAAEHRDIVSPQNLIGIFTLISGGSSIFILGRAVLLSTVAVETAQRLYHGMIASVFRAPVSFFDTTPSSRILNRSSTDQSTVDTDIPYRLAGLVFAVIQLLSIIILMSHVALQVIFLFLLVLAISAWYQAYYIPTARELARMVGIRKAPILHHFSESIAGAATIRCFNQEQRFLAKVMDLADDYSRVAFHNYATMEWLSVRINFLFNLAFFFVLVILVSLPRSNVDPSLAGLAATYGLNLNVSQAWVIWNLCNVENKMISVERILQFTNIPSEAPLIVQDYRPEPEWPKEGKIELHNLHIQYAPAAPMILKGITCTLQGQKKIGIVGRTGSGKSTFVQALFRVVEPCLGCIIIDGVDIRKIGLQDLRSKLGIIPQDPTLFQGSVRTNLDPLEQHSDQELWEVLKKCHLADIVRQDTRLLEAPVDENGQNWSVGQRQLVSLARLLLKKRRILVLDEATASIDTATDNLIQKTIREETVGCTVITVAHRINTIIDNDLVLLLNEGKIVEYDSPYQLLENNSSSFSKMVAEFWKRSQATTKT
ncbi:hypothetical protein L6164_028870 [Bauhinia variegata]|uniref:Uncharacterized protein n=1 Tax=Bauhinia variegata TaxID=167791 RepID=A0ACB9L7G9_BAUVA|nr:hypothetical protein L6164_028870 [Bauhinia variegata]